MIRLNWSAVLMFGRQADVVGCPLFVRDRHVVFAPAFHDIEQDLRRWTSLRAFRNATMTKYSLLLS